MKLLYLCFFFAALFKASAIAFAYSGLNLSPASALATVGLETPANLANSPWDNPNLY